VTRVLVVDDHTLVRDGICRLLESLPDLQVVGTAGCGRDAIQMCRGLCPDLVVLDYGLPDLDGLEVTRQIAAHTPGVRILIVTMHENEECAVRVMRAGATGYVLKGASTEELLTAVHKVLEGKVHVTQSLMEKMVSKLGQPSAEAPEACLSNRELQVLVALAQGATTREIATALQVSVSTVETYRSRVLEKLGLRNVADITRFAIRRQLIAATE